MILPCTRCGAPAGVTMNFNYAERRVWIDDLGDVDSGYALCESHGNRLTAPVGWALTDRRAAVRPLFAAKEVA